MINLLVAALAVASPVAAKAQTSTVQFVVSEFGTPTNGDAYILPLSNARDIRYARDILRFGSSDDGRLVSCQIQLGSDGVNCNYVAPGRPLWSWHVSQFYGFAQQTAEIYDGTPTQVEQEPSSWFGADGYGIIGFWAYSVTQELGPGPGISPSAAPSGPTVSALGSGRVRISWGDTSTNEDGFEYQREQQTQKLWLNHAMFGVGPNVTSVTETPGAGTFRYRVRSYNIAGSSAWTAWKTVKAS